jgi:hypothetical protein
MLTSSVSRARGRRQLTFRVRVAPSPSAATRRTTAARSRTSLQNRQKRQEVLVEDEHKSVLHALVPN